MGRRPGGFPAALALSVTLATGCGGDATGGAAAGAGSLIETTNFAFVPDAVSIPGGTTLRVRNGNAATSHTFTVPGQGIDVEVVPLATERVVIELEPGTYAFVCRFHGAQGMEGTLTVT